VTQTYTVNGLNPGTEYKFKVQSRNSYGYSSYSNEVAILAAETPATPAAPTTTIAGDKVSISWSAPDNRGSQILYFVVRIRKADGVSYAVELSDCDGSDSEIISSTSCQVPIATLRTGTF
jgi:hypothetical protein